MERATLASVGIHVLVALSIPALAWTVSTAPPVETVSFTHILHIEITPTQVPLHPRRARRAASRSEAGSQLRHHDHLVATSPFATRHRRRRSRPARPPPPLSAWCSAPATGDAESQCSAERDAVAPRREPSRASALTSPAATCRFGAEQPDPVLDPGVRNQLDALGAHVTLAVTVGEDGRTENIVFNPPIDPNVESRIRSLLADASWDPAVCGGGVSCEAQATIKL